LSCDQGKKRLGRTFKKEGSRAASGFGRDESGGGWGGCGARFLEMVVLSAQSPEGLSQKRSRKTQKDRKGGSSYSRSNPNQDKQISEKANYTTPKREDSRARNLINYREQDFRASVGVPSSLVTEEKWGAEKNQPSKGQKKKAPLMS